MTTTKPILFEPAPRAHETAPAISPPVWPGRKAPVTVKDLRPIPVCGSSIRTLAAQRRVAEGQRATSDEG